VIANPGSEFQDEAVEPKWSEPVQFAEGCTLNKPTVLKNGDWLLPVSDWHKKTARVFASTDEGRTWSEPRQAATVQNINARFFLRRLKSDRILLVKNGPPTERLAKRSHLSAYLSKDDGQTWTGDLLLDERGSVSYPDGFESPDGLIQSSRTWNSGSAATASQADGLKKPS